MGAVHTMIHRCLIQRNTSSDPGSSDPWGNEDVPTWVDLNWSSCRFWHDSQQTVVDGSSEKEITTRKLILPWAMRGQVTPDDRIARVQDRRLRVIADEPMRIDSIAVRRDHIELTMVNVS